MLVPGASSGVDPYAILNAENGFRIRCDHGFGHGSWISDFGFPIPFMELIQLHGGSGVADLKVQDHYVSEKRQRKGTYRIVLSFLDTAAKNQPAQLFQRWILRTGDSSEWLVFRSVADFLFRMRKMEYLKKKILRITKKAFRKVLL